MRHILLTITLVLLSIVFGESQTNESKPYQLKQAKKISNQTLELLQKHEWHVQIREMRKQHETTEIENPHAGEFISFSESGSILKGEQIIGYWQTSDKRLIRILPAKGETMLDYFEHFRGYFSLEEMEDDQLAFHRPLDHEGKTFIRYTLKKAQDMARYVPKSANNAKPSQIEISMESTREDIEHALKSAYFMRGKRLPSNLSQLSKEELFELYQALFR